MKLDSTNPVYQSIRGDHALYAKPNLTVEWNLNRYFAVVAENGPGAEEYDYDVEIFPIESLIEPNRPTKGIVKARVGEAMIANNYTSEGQTVRFYLADRDDIYKYWCSPMETDALGNMPTWTDFMAAEEDYAGDAVLSSVDWATESVCQPRIEYGQVVKSNKVVVGFENTWATPSAFTVSIRTTESGAWTTIATNPIINNDGTVTLYYDGTNWVDVKPANLVNPPVADVAAIRVSVTAMSGGIDVDGNPTFYTNSDSSGTGYTQTPTDGSNSFCNVIEISARREEDLSPWLISVDDTQDLGESSPITPIGTISSNVATINLSNIDGHFSVEDNPSYDQILDANAQFTLWHVYYSDISMDVEVGRVQAFRMFSDGIWSGQRGMEISVSVTDASKFLKEIKALPTMFEEMPVEQIVWRICDQIGFVDYDVVTRTTAVPTTVKYWWTDGEATVWELFNDLAVGTQTAIFFNHEGRLQVVNREAAYDALATPVWDIYGTKALDVNGDEVPYPAGVLPDMINGTPTDEMQANKVTITYQKTDISEWNNGHPKLDIVWEPGETTTLRAAPLIKTLELADTYFWVTSEMAEIWPYEGLVNIEGEIIRFKGKQFVYYEGTTRKTVVVNDADEYKLYNEKAEPTYKMKNHFSGAIKIEERGEWNSEKQLHSVDAAGYSVRSLRNGTRRVGVAGFKHNRKESTVSLFTNAKRFKTNDMLIATKGTATDQGWRFMGTRIRFKKEGRKDQRAGIVFGNSDNDEAGYYIEVMPTAKISPKERGKRNEVIFYTRETNGAQKRHTGKGDRAAIVENRWFDIDVAFSLQGNDHKIKIWLNGKMIVDKLITGADKAAFNGRFGMFVRGNSHAEFEYLYGIQNPNTIPDDDVSFFDIVEGGYRAAQWDREWVYDWRNVKRRKKKRSGRARRRFNNRFFDEFGPIVHEIREYDVKFEPAPVTESRLFLTNDSKATTIEYRSGPFGAGFDIANTARVNAVLSGEDAAFAAGSGDSVEQVFSVVGRVVTQEETEEKVIENKEMIRRRGIIETEISSPWIQSEAAATRLGEWIESRWSLGSEQIEVTLFGNPLLELTDVVTVTNSLMDLNGEKYYVFGIQSSFKQGLETTVTLRKVV